MKIAIKEIDENVRWEYAHKKVSFRPLWKCFTILHYTVISCENAYNFDFHRINHDNK